MIFQLLPGPDHEVRRAGVTLWLCTNTAIQAQLACVSFRLIFLPSRADVHVATDMAHEED
jgi:hypothetical protein